MKVLRDFLTSLQVRISLLLIVGVAAASIAALEVVEHDRKRDVETLIQTQIAGRVQNLLSRAAQNASKAEADLRAGTIPGVQDDGFGLRGDAVDKSLSAAVTARLGRGAPVTVWTMPAGCPQGVSPAGDPPPRCWRIKLIGPQGIPTTFVAVIARDVDESMVQIAPDFAIVVLFTSLILTAVVAGVIGAPLRILSQAARAFSVSLTPEPLPERGPHEVRSALATFNLMQRRVSDGLFERTQILAAIAHDLKTPLTRLRLRLEQVEASALRDRLTADLALLDRRVREGLEWARSRESNEPWALVNIDSLLASLVEDAAEFGASVHLLATCGLTLKTRPDALSSCLTNLIDNAIGHGGGDVDVSCETDGSFVTVTVRDHGEEIAEADLERLFQPFIGGPSYRRLSGGAGLGLSIARAQAKLCLGEVRLANAAGGGLSASVELPLR
jgi:signal transduction histidine kinase